MNTPLEVSRTAVQELDSADYRRALGHVPTSVAVITGKTRHGPVGMTVGSFTSVSLDPPLIAFFVGTGSSTWSRLYEADRFGVNILGHAHGDLCRVFSRRVEDRFDGVAWHETDSGVPILEKAIVALECTRVKVDVIGDHYQVIGRVESLELRPNDPPLIFLRGDFVNMTPELATN